MLQTITDLSEISRYQNELELYLQSRLPQKMPLVIGHQGESYNVHVYTNGDLWYTRWPEDQHELNRYWNAFGLLTMKVPGNIIVEINFPPY